VAKPAWSIEGPHFINCNCDYGCPCQFNALPKDGYCRVSGAGLLVAAVLLLLS
jgi:hypothetical protein